jgi:cytoskeletal protein CcmA (bactofilin family)
MASLIQIRRGTLAEWQAANPVLSNGEITFVTDENKIKIGNGSSNWASLPYLEAAIDADSVVLGQDTTGNYVEIIDAGSGISISGSGSESASVTISNTGVLSLLGTENEITVSASSGDITLSLPTTINADTTGNAATATALATARTINLGGDLSGSASFNGTSDITITATVDSQSSVNSITGTENEITVSASVGDVTLSLPETINANTTGTAASLTTARTIALSGDVSGSVTFDGSASVNITTEIQPNSVVLGTDTAGNYVATASAGAGISVTGSGSENSDITITNTGVTSLAGTASQISVSASNGDSTLSLPSSVVFPGTVTLNAAPTQSLHAATKQYVDETAEGLKAKPAVEIATTASLDATYDNGTSGVGATLTANSNGAFPEIDGVTLTSTTPGSNGVLVKNQSNPAHNGRYNLTQIGDGSNPWILTRCGLCDQSSEIAGMYIFVKDGTNGAGTGWVAIVDDPSTFTIGTDDIDFVQFSGAGTYTAGTGLELNGTVFSNIGVLSLAGTADEVEVSASSGNITISLPTTINANTTGSAATLTNSRTIELTGDVTGSASFNGSANATISSTLENTAVSPASYGSASAVGTFTVDAKGRLTAASNTPIAIAQSAVTNLTTDLGLKANLASPTFTGTPAAPTAAVDTNTTQIATTAYVIGQGYLKSTSASSTYQPLNSNLTSIAETDISQSGKLNVSVTAPGNVWTTVTSNFGTTLILSIAYGNGLWVAGGNFGPIRTSTDGSTWTTVTSNFGTTSIQSVAYGNGLWVAGGYTGQIRTSTDGSTWTTVTSNFGTTNINSVAYGNGLWVAGGYTGQMRTSTDGSTWTTVTSNFGDTTIRSIAYGNGLWIAGGNYGQMRTSTDGSTWTTVTSNFGNSLVFSIAYGNGLWIAGGLSGQMRTSTDGSTWTTVTSNFGTTIIWSIAYGNGLWIAGGNAGQMRTSTDGSTWTTVTSNFGSTLIRSIAYGNNLWVAGGNYGSTRISTSQSVWSIDTTPYATLSDITKITTNIQTASYTLAVSDAGKVVEMNVGSANDLTVPLNSSVAIPVGSSIDVIQYGAGQTTIVAAGGVTIRSKEGSLKLTGQYSGAKLYKRGTDEWVVVGDLTA